MTERTAAPSEVRTLAEKIEWLIRRATPAERAPFSNAEVAALIRQATGEAVSYGTVWEWRSGRTTNPSKRVMRAVAQTFGVTPGFFFEEDNEDQTSAELAALMREIRDSGIDHGQVRALLRLSESGRTAIAGVIEHTLQAEAKAT
jgi:transcriptional regulator with XRE-family HTH domain